MKKRGLVIVGIFFFLLVTVLISGCFPAKTELLTDESRGIAENEYFYVYFESSAGETIKANINVVNGESINIIFTNYEGFSDFSNEYTNIFNYYEVGSGFNILLKSFNFNVQEDKTYYIIMDNAGMVDGGAVPSGDVTVHYRIEIEH